MQPYEVYLAEFNDALNKLKEITPTIDSVNTLLSEEEDLQFITAFRDLIRIRNILITFVDFKFEDTDIKLTKTDQNGSVIWESIIGYDIDGENTNYGYDMSNDIILSNDGGYIITGQYHATHPDILIIKINDQGSIQNKHIISTAPPSQRVVESGKSVLSIDNGYIILASLSQSSANGPSDIWLSEYIESTLNDGDTT